MPPSAGAGHIQLWDADTGKEKTPDASWPRWFAHLAFSPDSRTLTTHSYDRIARDWDVATGKELRRRKDPATDDLIVPSPDGKVRAAAGEDRVIRGSDSSTGKLLTRLVGHHDPVRSCAFIALFKTGRSYARPRW